MDEVENPEVSPAGQEIAATLESSAPLDSGLAAPQDSDVPVADTAELLGLDNSAQLAPPTTNDHEGLVTSPEAILPSDVSDLPAPDVSPPNGPAGTESTGEEQILPVLPLPNPKRPVLRRDGSSIPPKQPPPAIPEEAPQESRDVDFSQQHPESLTIAQLKDLRRGFPDALRNTEPQELLQLERVYDYDYRDTESFPVELEEWFTYSEPERARLRQIHTTFKQAWSKQATSPHGEFTYDFTESPELGMSFVNQYIDQLRMGTPEEQNEAIQVICYIALGNWEETAGKLSVVDPFASLLGGQQTPATQCSEEYQAATFQIQWMINTLCLLARQGAVRVVFERLRATCDRDIAAANSKTDPNSEEESAASEDNVSIDLWCSLTLMHLFVEVARMAGDTPDSRLLLHELALVQSDLLLACIKIITQMRWDETAPIPPTKVFLLTWKTILLCFGGLDEVENVKRSFQEEPIDKDKRGEPIITASPLDYHLFRQEICSKYPAYQPPPPLFPFEPENNTILPPLRHRQSKLDSIDSTASEGSGIHGASLMHQPVHIATPAPSPPPSPAMGGKGGKKQNYQTNQMFPFLYPPLDASSNDIGGKGMTELQDMLAGRKWEGSDVPTSILEAAELFSKRMRATRAMKQLWETRVDFIKFERGWKEGQDNADVDEDVVLDEPVPPKQESQSPLQSDVEKRLAAVEDFYRDALPDLQSVVGVLLHKVLEIYGDLNMFSPEPRFENGNGVAENMGDSAEQINNSRTQEILSKAVSGILLLLLKWFRVSHVLRYEYLTQLLLDTNYVPLFIKMWSVTDISRACHYKLDKEEYNFFNFCRANSRNALPVPQPSQVMHPSEMQPQAEESEDEAMPPPIKLRRDEIPEGQSPSMSPQTQEPHPPEVDELGYPVTPLPLAPIRKFSARNIFTFINYLRILQKITRRKAHRSLLLVSYKSSNLLRKSLRVPVDMMRYYTLKLFKSQVPYCGRKWRQTNMKIITAVWLSVPADLRDDWLSGGGGGMGGAGPGDVDGTVEEALPLEQSLRALTHWWNVRTYPDVMGVDREMISEEQDFFAKELEKIELNRAEEEMLEDSLLDEPWAPLEAY